MWPTCSLRFALEPSAFSTYDVPLPARLALGLLDGGVALGDELLAPLPLSALVRMYWAPAAELLAAELLDPPGEVRHPVTVIELPVPERCGELPGCVVGLCAAAVRPAMAKTPQVAKICLVMNVCLLWYGEAFCDRRRSLRCRIRAMAEPAAQTRTRRVRFAGPLRTYSRV